MNNLVRRLHPAFTIKLIIHGITTWKARKAASGAHAGARHRRRVDVHARILLLPLGTSVLEPDFHLGLGQAEAQGQVEPFAHAEVSGGLEFVLEGH